MSTPATIERPTIEFPREPGESARAHASKVAYITMGPARSLDRLRQSYGRTAAYTRQLEVWSTQYGWVSCAQKYDDALALITVQHAAEQYRRDLEDHRKRYGDAGKNLYAIAVGLTNAIAAQLRGQTIEGKDGKKYTIPAMKLDQGAVTVLARALTIAADLEAHALRLGEILPKLDHDNVLDSQ